MWGLYSGIASVAVSTVMEASQLTVSTVPRQWCFPLLGNATVRGRLYWSIRLFAFPVIHFTLTARFATPLTVESARTA